MSPSRTKTQAERDREWRRKEEQAFDFFKARLEAANSFEGAARMVLGASPDTVPGHRWYRNLGVFLHNGFRRPPGANSSELQLYAAFLRRLPASGFISVEEAEAAVKNLMSGPGAFERQPS